MNMKYRRIIQAAFGSYWAIIPEKLEAIVAFLELQAKGTKFSPEEIRARIGAKAPAAASGNGSGSGNQPTVAVIPVYGIISQRASMMDDISGPGGTSTERVAREFRARLNDPNIKAIILDIDSPGGTVYGVEELAEEIFKARGGKPIVAVCNSLAASAAYWIASAADEIVVTPSGEVGSIGVYACHTDISKLMETEGVKTTLISAGEFKVEGNPYEPLSAEGKDYIQQRIDDYFGAFTKSVARGRGVPVAQVKSEFGKGRVVGADQAVKNGMADRVATLDETIVRMAKMKVKPAVTAAAGESLTVTAEAHTPEIIVETAAIEEPKPEESGLVQSPGPAIVTDTATHQYSLETARRRQAMLELSLT